MVYLVFIYIINVSRDKLLRLNKKQIETFLVVGCHFLKMKLAVEEPQQILSWKHYYLDFTVL